MSAIFKMAAKTLHKKWAVKIQHCPISSKFYMQNCSSNGSREATHRFRTSNNAKSNPEIKGRNSIFLNMTLYK
jgi:hypothetical protein